MSILDMVQIDSRRGEPSGGAPPNANIRDRIQAKLSASPNVLFMKGTPDFPQCGFSAQVVAALRACQADFTYVNIFEDQELREGLKAYSNWPTYPQLYVNGELIGGADIIVKMYHTGELQELLGQNPGRKASGEAPRESQAANTGG
jgi:monothiol glutaredoxin